MRRKSFVVSILSFLLCLCMHISAVAAEPLQIGLDGYVAEDGVLKLYVNHNQDTSFNVTSENIKVTFGSNEMEIQDVAKLAEANVPISYKCVVDISGSMSQGRIDEAKTVIKKLAQLKKPEDTIAITAMGNDLIQSEYMSDPMQIAEKADVLTLTHEDTNLYYAISQEIKGMQTSTEINRKKCLIIFSDGADDQATGITREEAENSVKDSHIPVFTVGLLKSKDNEKSKEMAKVLGSFARISSGGEHFAPALGEGSVDTIAEAITGRINSSFVLETGLENVDVSGKEVVLKVAFLTGNGEMAEDSVNVSESDIKIIKQEQEKIAVIEKPIVKETIEQEPVEPENVEEEADTDGKIIIIVVGISVLILILIIVIILVLKKKKKESATGSNSDSENVEPMDMGSPTEAVYDEGKTIGGMNNSDYTFAPGNDNATLPLATPQPSGKKYRITLVRMGKGDEKKYTIDLYDKYTIGRSSAKADLAISNDSALSGLHCTFLVKAGKIFLKDEKATNGTFVNGVPITGSFELNQDDIILIGSYEYRVSWK